MSLDGARGLAVTPDPSSSAQNVLVTSRNDDALTDYLRNPDGSLGNPICFARSEATGCNTPPQDSFVSPGNVAVSPGGTSVYVAGYRSISVFTRLVHNGALTPVGCIADDGRYGCTDPPRDSLWGVSDLVVSTDGSNVYAVSVGNVEGAMTVFTRAENGSIAFAQCIADGGRYGCDDPPQDTLGSPGGVAVSPEGRSV